MTLTREAITWIIAKEIISFPRKYKLNTAYIDSNE